MKYLKFYYFSFLFFYKDKPESWITEYRSLFLVLITVTSAVSFVLLMLYPNFNGIYPYVRVVILTLFIASFIIMQRVLISTGKYQLIFDEFENHPINTRTNRVTCWVIWLLSFTAPIVLAIIQKGDIS